MIVLLKHYGDTHITLNRIARGLANNPGLFDTSFSGDDYDTIDIDHEVVDKYLKCREYHEAVSVESFFEDKAIGRALSIARESRRYASPNIILFTAFLMPCFVERMFDAVIEVSKDFNKKGIEDNNQRNFEKGFKFIAKAIYSHSPNEKWFEVE